MKISLISAMTDDRVIGINNSLPWKLPSDMRWFRKHTLGKPIIMGRKTFESFGAKPLPERMNIIITNNNDYQADNCMVVNNIDSALQVAGNVDEVMVIGGASFYQQMLPYADRLYLTFVHADIEGDAWFPEFDKSAWKETLREDVLSDEKNQYPHTFVVMEKAHS